MYQRRRYTHAEIEDAIVSTDGARAGWRITKDSNAPLVWCWFRVASIAGSAHALVLEDRVATAGEMVTLTDLIRHGDVVCRMVRGGRSAEGYRYAHVSIE